MIETKLVSVIVPTFNRENSIKAAISSCLGQTYKNIEIITVDDASRDNTQEVVRSFNDPRIKFFHHNTNKGPAATRNTGLRNTKGDFIAFLDSDDEWMPEKIEKQLTAFNLEAKQSGLIFTNGYNEAEEKDFIPEDTNSGIIYDPVKDKFFPLRILITPPSSWLIPLEVIRDTGYFDESMYNWDDGDFFVRLAYKYPIYYLNENLVVWHLLEKHVNVVSWNLIKGKETLSQNIMGNYGLSANLMEKGTMSGILQME